jgi:hypothetical protein
MNPAEIYYAYRDLYEAAITMSQEEYLETDKVLYTKLKQYMAERLAAQQSDQQACPDIS